VPATKFRALGQARQRINWSVPVRTASPASCSSRSSLAIRRRQASCPRMDFVYASAAFWLRRAILVLAVEPDKGAEGQKIDREELPGGPNFSAKDEIIGARNVIRSTASRCRTASRWPRSGPW
jgi:hypothetical protein